MTFDKMPNFLESCASVISSKLKTLLGAVLCLAFLAFAILSIPVYIFRVIAKLIAKYFRPDLGEILNGQSCCFVGDFFANTTPRSNIIVVLHCRGTVKWDDFKNRVLKGMIQSRSKSTGRLLYERLQQYPVKWLGFSFWKKASATFSIDDHVFKHSGVDTPINNDQLTSFVEKLLNARFSKEKSPWEFHVIENFQKEEKSPLLGEKRKNSEEKHGIIIFKIHHCLADGTGILQVLLEGLLENYSVREFKRPKAREIKRSFLESFLYWLLFPVNLIVELSYGYSHNFRSNPWKVPDADKKWNQVYGRSELIPIDLVKEIKNAFGVSFTSVLLSVISGAVQKSMGTYHNVSNGASSSWPYFSILPSLDSSSERQVLENHFTATVLDLPYAVFPSPVERLQAVNQMLERSRSSVVPLMFQLWSVLVGANLRCIGSVVVKNRQVPIGLTNFAATPENELVLFEDTRVVQIDAVVGGMSGNFGAVIATVSHNGFVRINVSAEEAIMTQTQMKRFTKHIDDEIESLRDLMMMMKKKKGYEGKENGEEKE